MRLQQKLTVICSLLFACAAWSPTLADIQATKLRAAALTACPADLPVVTFVTTGHAICPTLDGFAVGCQLGENVRVALSDRDATLYVLEHELVHWCLWRSTGDGDGGHTLSVWSRF